MKQLTKYLKFAPVLILVPLALMAGCSTTPTPTPAPAATSDTPVAPPATTSTTSTPPSTTSTTSTPTYTFMPSAVTTKDLNVTGTDPDMKVTTTIQTITSFVQPLPVFASDDISNNSRMLGVRLHVDASKSPFLGAMPEGSSFNLVAPDGTKGRCEGITGYGDDAATQAILTAIGGDVAYKTATPDHIGDGWFVCNIAKYQDSAFPDDLAGIKLVYDRPEAKDSAGTVYPDFTFSADLG